MMLAPISELDVGDGLALRVVPCSCREPECVSSLVLLGADDWWLLVTIDFGDEAQVAREIALLEDPEHREAGRRLIAAFGEPWEELTQTSVVTQAYAIDAAGPWLGCVIGSLDVDVLAGLRQWIGAGDAEKRTLPALKALHDYIGAVG